MTRLIVPSIAPDEYEKWASIGPLVAQFLEERCVFGPGSLQGLPYVLDEEKRAFLWRAYEIYPRGSARAGRRRFRRCGMSVRKGVAKTEFAAAIAFAELHPDGPVRCDGFDADGNPVGRPVVAPFIPMMAYTEKQTDELAYGALKYMVEEGPDAMLFVPNKDAILRLNARGREDGKVVSLSGSPNANDGARTTFQHFDETHRMELPRLIDAHKTMLENMPKRPMEDPWSFETTTAGVPGAGSVAEKTHREALSIAKGEIKDPKLFYIHREAGANHDLSTTKGRIEAIKEATGPVGEFGPGQFEDIASSWDRPGADRAYLERVWLNRWTRSDAQAFDVEAFAACTGDPFIPEGSLVTVGFDGARLKDSTGFVLTDVETGLQMPYGLWESPIDIDEDAPRWEVPEDEVQEKFDEIFDRFDVHMVYADPPYWNETVGKWAGQYPDRVLEWWTLRRRPMSQAVRAFSMGIADKTLTHTGNADYIRHVGNAGRQETNLLDEEGQKVILLCKLRPELKFDLCMAGILSWQARLDALADGAIGGGENFVPYRIA